jgi:hypothetical protein
MFFGEDVNEISFTVKIVSAKPANTFRPIVWPMGMSLTPAETKLDEKAFKYAVKASPSAIPWIADTSATATE